MGSINQLGDPTFIGAWDSGFSKPTTTTRVPPVAPIEDQVQIATIPPTGQIEQLQKTNPSNFQSVVNNAIRELRAAAFATTNPDEAAYFSDLAARFQLLEDTNNAGNPYGLAQYSSL